ncbi:hypothetical protein PoB_004221200 [Plakobranchus ocellatus]|uniref:Uncharacterized protein n=1 Tax=Plakobranchus ocellatus TaxID=259542 RepID=A0AAV4B9A7_9GAST|nr:hypothetical protein PoB_004221200 [Plakobranchus ocellatus]
MSSEVTKQIKSITAAIEKFKELRIRQKLKIFARVKCAVLIFRQLEVDFKGIRPSQADMLVIFSGRYLLSGYLSGSRPILSPRLPVRVKADNFSRYLSESRPIPSPRLSVRVKADTFSQATCQGQGRYLLPGLQVRYGSSSSRNP